jgi:hypothetical protein
MMHSLVNRNCTYRFMNHKEKVYAVVKGNVHEFHNLQFYSAPYSFNTHVDNVLIAFKNKADCDQFSELHSSIGNKAKMFEMNYSEFQYISSIMKMPHVVIIEDNQIDPLVIHFGTAQNLPKPKTR